MKSIITGPLNILVFLTILVTGCAQKQVGREEPGVMDREPVQELSLAEQNKRAFDIFRQILPLSESPEREKNIPEIKALYREIIAKYPQTRLAQESYLRLVILAKEAGTVAGDAEAQRIAAEFLVNYPESKLKRIIVNEAARGDNDK
ncbi:MAG: hypothetical protein R3297_05045 [Desulfobulbales bacterium]|nr:hypothetical protein [Desulfobulbales bacterium]